MLATKFRYISSSFPRKKFTIFHNQNLLWKNISEKKIAIKNNILEFNRSFRRDISKANALKGEYYIVVLVRNIEYYLLLTWSNVLVLADPRTLDATQAYSAESLTRQFAILNVVSLVFDSMEVRSYTSIGTPLRCHSTVDWGTPTKAHFKLCIEDLRIELRMF